MSGRGREVAPLEQRVSIVTLGVGDLQRSIAFYEKLGWRRSLPELTGVAFFQCPGMVFGLFPLDALLADAGLDPASAVGVGRASLAYNTRDKDAVEVVLAEAEAAGGSIVKKAQEAFWGGYHGYFLDPDGHLWEVAWNPGLEIDATGAAVLK